MDFPGSSNGKESACNARDLGLIPGSGRTPGEGQHNPLQCSCLDSRQEEPGGLQSTGGKELDTTEQLTHTITSIHLPPKTSPLCNI